MDKFSHRISETIKIFEDAQKDYQWSRDEISNMDKLTQDYLHKLELDDLKYTGRAKIATQLKRCRQERRAHKDTMEILEPIVQFANSEKGKNLINLLREALGKTRKAEERMQNRIYYPRVLNK